VFLLDTNAVSEPRKPSPDPAYMSWLADCDAADLWISALTLGELRYGVLRLDAGARRHGLELWLAEASALFHDRILPVDQAVTERWADVTLANVRAGRTRSLIDEFIASTALVKDLTIVTRNVRDFEGSGCKVLSPWTT
jgi:toxin FitB